MASNVVEGFDFAQDFDIHQPPVRKVRANKQKMSGTDGLTEMSGSRSESAGGLDLSDMGATFSKQMGDSKSVRPDKRARIMNQIYNAVGAKSSNDKLLTDYALTYLFVVHGASMNVDWSSVELIPGGGTRPVMMNVIVRLIGTVPIRKFAVGFSDKAIELHNESADVREKLRERAARAGLPITDTLAVIDFINSPGENPHAVGLRVRAKYSAVMRAESNGGGDNSLGKASTHAVNHVQNAAVPRGSQRDEDPLGPLN